MNWIDYIIITIISLLSLMGFIRGFIQDALSLITWGAMFFITINYYSYFAIMLTIFNNERVRNIIAIIVLFIATLIIGTMLNYIVNSLIRESNLLMLNKIFGICFGLLQGILVVSAIIFFFIRFTNFPENLDWKQSRLIPEFNYIIKWISNYFN
ncbi:CvpA family protein [Pantoea sp. Mhis]|uniref:CvpA family protein n=1 Tax=Pantoea sp. Mhis TaxID=2576759 RepID=UPI00135C960A|nr:CvpA family protein [Pantoea sp. Mhis]MXP56088.1 colicin V production protein [Pantoea sp. Mhis]